MTVICLVAEVEFVLRAETEVDCSKATDAKQRGGDGEGRRPDAGDDDPRVATGPVDTEAERTSHGQQPVGA